MLQSPKLPIVLTKLNLANMDKFAPTPAAAAPVKIQEPAQKGV